MDLVFRNDLDVSGWRVRVGATLDGALSSRILFTVERDRHFISPGLWKSGVRFPDTSMRGLTRVMFDPDEYRDPANGIPGDGDLIFLRVEERNAVGDFRPEGPILVVPTASFFSVEAPSIMLVGTAPAAPLDAAGTPPAGALHVALPRAVKLALFRNTGANEMMVGFDPAQAMFPVASERDFQVSHYNEFFVCVDHATNTTTFSAFLGLINGALA